MLTRPEKSFSPDKLSILVTVKLIKIIKTPLSAQKGVKVVFLRLLLPELEAGAYTNHDANKCKKGKDGGGHWFG